MCGTGLLEMAVQVPKPLLQALRDQSLAYACECAHAMSTFMRANHNHPPRSIHDVSTRGARVGHGVRTEKSRSLVGSSSIKKLGLSANVLSSCSLRPHPGHGQRPACATRAPQRAGAAGRHLPPPLGAGASGATIEQGGLISGSSSSVPGGRQGLRAWLSWRQRSAPLP